MGFKTFLSESARVIRVTRKPGKEEFWTIVKVSSIGILLIGFIGFLLRMIERGADNYLFRGSGLIVASTMVIAIILFLMYYKRD